MSVKDYCRIYGKTRGMNYNSHKTNDNLQFCTIYSANQTKQPTEIGMSVVNFFVFLACALGEAEIIHVTQIT